jgi:hypothetical protein
MFAGGRGSVRKEKVMKIIIAVAIAVLVAVLMTILSAVPPLSTFCNWAERNNMKFLWNGLVAGVIALCLLLYCWKR